MANDDLVEIYKTHDALEAEVIRDEVLGPNDIEGTILDRTSHAFPSAAMPGGYFIAVEPSEEGAARTLLEEARHSNVISSGGAFVER